MTVWILEYRDTDNGEFDIIGVFSTYELALNQKNLVASAGQKYLYDIYAEEVVEE